MSDEIEIGEVVAYKVKDEDLLFLNSIVNKFDYGIGVTLFSNGSVTTGTLISGKQYYSFVAERLKEAGSVGESLAQFFENKGATSYTSDDPDFLYPNNFLHLENVHIRQDNGRMAALNNAMLRIKIEEIDGHMIGTAN